MMAEYINVPKAPRWINTEAGHKAWCEYTTWRGKAIQAFSVQDRAQLLDEAERITHETVASEPSRFGDETADFEHLSS